MNLPWLKYLKGPIPRSLRRWLRLSFGWKWFRGNFASWPAARLASSGYDDAAVLERVTKAARAARDGFAAWDRDGMAFAESEIHPPLLAALRASGVAENGRLHVVDFGGGLGGTWRQYRSALADLSEIRWCVVEQPHFVEVGTREFSNDEMSFHSTLETIPAGATWTVVLFSSVLQYLETPHETLTEAVRLGFRHLIIDRTSFWNGGRDRLTVQFTPPALGGGSYPCWLFDRATLLASLSQTHEFVSEWPGFDDVDPRVQFRGMYFRRRNRMSL